MQSYIWKSELDALVAEGVETEHGTCVPVEALHTILAPRWTTKKERNGVPQHERCIALKKVNTQCTRHRQLNKGIPLCKTHENESARPNGVVQNPIESHVKISQVTVQNVQLFADAGGRVYDTIDVLNRAPEPQVVARIEQGGGDPVVVPP